MNKIIQTNKAQIRIDEEGILRVNIKNKAKFNEIETRELFDIYRGLGLGKTPVLELIQVDDIFMMDENAQKYTTSQNRTFFIAGALVSNSTGIRLLLNFYNTFFNRDVPFKMFSTEKKALEWLRKFKQK
jgi:hypothetical protein